MITLKWDAPQQVSPNAREGAAPGPVATHEITDYECEVIAGGIIQQADRNIRPDGTLEFSYEPPPNVTSGFFHVYTVTVINGRSERSEPVAHPFNVSEHGRPINSLIPVPENVRIE